MQLVMQKNISLKPYTTFHIGGPARFFASVHSEEEMKEALLFAQREQIPYFVLGKGSNILFDDRGYNGLVIYNQLKKIVWKETFVEVQSGYSFAQLGRKSAQKGLSGLEFASGIPGSVGGAVFMNAGACGVETKDSLQKIYYMEHTGDAYWLDRKSVHFSYRFSSFHQMQGIIIAATFALKKDSVAKTQQKEQLAYRIHTQPYEEKSAGCAFQNPKASSAGFLIEQCQLKGKQIGGAQVSFKHANFIINHNAATAKNVLDLITYIQAEVKRQTQVELETEVRFIPYER